MGAGYHGGFGHTKGNKEYEINLNKSLILELKNKNIKFSEKDMIFITKDKTGQIVWLEKGNSTAGLEHILNGNGQTIGHAKDFENAFGITKDKIPRYLKTIMSNGVIVSNILKPVANTIGFERTYSYDGNYYVVTGIGTNGFIVSAYPKTK